MEYLLKKIVLPFAIVVIMVVACKETGNSSIANTPYVSPNNTSDLGQYNNINLKDESCVNMSTFLSSGDYYNGISLYDTQPKKLKHWMLKFENSPDANGLPRVKGLMTFQDIIELTDSVIDMKGCQDLSGKEKAISSGDELSLVVDIWLVKDLYDTAVKGTIVFTELMNGEMVIGKNTYPEITNLFRIAKFDDTICQSLEDLSAHKCSIKACLDSLESQSPETCTGKWFSLVQPRYSHLVKDLPMREVCQVENCGLEKDSKFIIDITVN